MKVAPERGIVKEGTLLVDVEFSWKHAGVSNFNPMKPLLVTTPVYSQSHEDMDSRIRTVSNPGPDID